jgi:hypothetical protein
VKALRSLLLASLFAVAAVANTARAADDYKFEFHGFVTGSLFLQNQVFAGGSGQDNLLAAPAPAQAAPAKPNPGVPTNGTATKSGTFLGGDERQSRWIFVMTGPQGSAFGATPKSYFEGDFYGAPTSTAANSAEHTQARVRAAFGELKWGNTQLQFGQYSSQLILAQLSATVAHIANPITFGTGTIGSRAIGIRVVHAMPMGDMKLTLAGELLAPKWNDPARGATVASISQGWASGVPQIGVRLNADGKAGGLGYALYLAGEFESVNLKGFGDSVVNGGAAGVVLADGSRKTSLSPYAVEVGGGFNFAPVSLNFNVYTGKATGLWAGAINQQGDISDFGYWAQLGVTPTKMIGIYALYGQGSPSKKDIRNWGAGTRGANTLMGGIVKISDGGYTFAAEYLAFNTKYLTGTFAAPGADVSTDAYQFVVSGHYAF